MKCDKNLKRNGFKNMKKRNSPKEIKNYLLKENYKTFFTKDFMNLGN